MVTAVADADDAEVAETIDVGVRHNGGVVGTAAVTILPNAVKLRALHLSGIDIGTFSPETRTYEASVMWSVDSTVVNATPADATADVAIAPADADGATPWHEVALAAGVNDITVTVTAAGGVVERVYTVTVTREAKGSRDIDGLAAAGIQRARGLWSDGETLWVLDDSVQTLKIFAFTLADGTRVPEKDVAMYDNPRLYGLWSNGQTMWAVDSDSNNLKAFDLTTRQPDAARDVPLHGGSPRGVAGDGNTLWVMDYRTFSAIRAYDVTSGARDVAEDLYVDPALHGYPTRGWAALWTDGDTLLAVNDSTDRIYAYDLGSGQWDPSREVALRSGNGEPTGLWSDGDTIWVANDKSAGDDKLYAYAMPLKASRLRALTLSSIDIGAFLSTRAAYSARVGSSIESTTVEATAEDAGASVHIWPADADTATPGHQVSIGEGATVITIAVTSQGHVAGTYEITVTKEANTRLSALTLSDIDIGTFSSSQTSYSARVGTSVESTTVEATAEEEESGATVVISPADEDAATPGHQVATVETTTVITISVTSGSNTRQYTITLTKDDAALVAEFTDVPATHDGTSFSFELSFSEAVMIPSLRTMRNHVLEVGNGTVVKAKRIVKGSNLRWQITVEPSGTNPVSIVLPADRACTETGAVCTLDSRRVANRVEETIPWRAVTSNSARAGPVSALQALAAIVDEPGQPGLPSAIDLAQGNGRPAGLWSDGERLWVANAQDDDRRLYAYRLGDGARESTRDIVTHGVPRGLWSDGETVWVSTRGGGGVLQAYRLANGARDTTRDATLQGRSTSPAGLWSDGTTLWAVDWLRAAVQAYRLADGTRDASRDLTTLASAGNLMAFGLWSDGETVWVSDHGERVYAYHLADGTHETAREVDLGPDDRDPMGVWSNETAMWLSAREASTVTVRELPAAVARLGTVWTKVESDDAVVASGAQVQIPDVALRERIEAALGKDADETIWESGLASLDVLDVRDAGVVNLEGLQHASGLAELDLSFNPLEKNLAVLSSLSSLERLYLDGAVSSAQLTHLSGLTGLKVLSVRSNGLADVTALGSLSGLQELDVGDNRLGDLSTLSNLTALRALDASGNRVEDLSPLSSLSGLRRLTLTDNEVGQLRGLSNLTRLEELGLAGNAVTELSALTELPELRRLDLRGNRLEDVGPLAELPSLGWVHVGGCGITDFTALDGREGLAVEGRFDQVR